MKLITKTTYSIEEFPQEVIDFVKKNYDEFNYHYDNIMFITLNDNQNTILEFVPEYEEEKQWEEKYYYFMREFTYYGQNGIDLSQEEIKNIVVQQEIPQSSVDESYRRMQELAGVNKK